MTTTQQTLVTETAAGRKAVVNAFAQGAINTEQSLRLSAANLSALDYSFIHTGDQQIGPRGGGPSYTQWQLRWEIKI